MTLLKLMSEMVADEHGLAASIGRENEPFGLGEASVVASDYDATGARARVGVLGPDAHGLPDESRGGAGRRPLPHPDARRRRERPLTRHP